MKVLNCVFTRVHWAQDKRVLDYCDRHGILMQEEVPAWGPETFANTSDEMQSQLERNGLEQFREMIARDRNHPSIVSWGLCNEVDGKNPRARAFARLMSAEARKLDPSRLHTYASHTLGHDPGADMAGEFDFISTNEYYGSWTPGSPRDVHDHLERIVKAFPGKPIVVSEYGWCECQPSLPAGDEHRVEIVNGHTEVFRGFPSVAGAIYFDFNDYRTLVGDKGVGSFRQRVHGVVDLYASRKPSFQVLRVQASPIETITITRPHPTEFSLKVTSRNTLPAYTLRSYRVRWVAFGYDQLPMEGMVDQLPTLRPGDIVTLTTRFTVGEIMRVTADVLRPTGYAAASTEWRTGPSSAPSTLKSDWALTPKKMTRASRYPSPWFFAGSSSATGHFHRLPAPSLDLFHLPRRQPVSPDTFVASCRQNVAYSCCQKSWLDAMLVGIPRESWRLVQAPFPRTVPSRGRSPLRLPSRSLCCLRHLHSSASGFCNNSNQDKRLFLFPGPGGSAAPSMCPLSILL